MGNFEKRQTNIEQLAGDGDLAALKNLLGELYTQLEIDTALENAIAYSRIEVADFLLGLGAKFENYKYQSVYYAVHNNEMRGLKYAISKGVDINVENGMLINTSIITAINNKDVTIVKWLLENGADLKYLTVSSMAVAKKFGSSELNSLINNN